MDDHAQCPFCMKSRPLKASGEFHKHTRGGGPGGRKPCESSGLTPEQAREVKRTGNRPDDSEQPEDIF